MGSIAVSRLRYSLKQTLSGAEKQACPEKSGQRNGKSRATTDIALALILTAFVNTQHTMNGR